MKTKTPEDIRKEEALADEIERESPEGRPANPAMRAGGIGLTIVGVTLAIVLVGIVLAIAWDRTMGIIIASLGVLFMALNPAVWGSAVRAAEREKIAKGEHSHAER